jgi:hypothetical protein
MNRQEILMHTHENGKMNHFAGKIEWYLKKNILPVYEAIMKETSFLPPTADLVERIFYIENHFDSLQKCPHCNRDKKKYIKSKREFTNTCGGVLCMKVQKKEILTCRWNTMSESKRQLAAGRLAQSGRKKGDFLRGKSLEEIHGKEKAVCIKKKMSSREIKPETYIKSVKTRRKNPKWHSEETRSKISDKLKIAWKDGKFDEYKDSFELAKSKLSEKMKYKILNGEFTPPITNSWTKWKSFVNMNGKTRKFRSDWEALFFLSNTELKYESVRIPYKVECKNKVYIVDFEDEKAKIIYEVKPSSLRGKKDIVDTKENVAKIWAEQNGYSYKVIDEYWFSENVDKIDLDGNEHLREKLFSIRNKLNKRIQNWEILTPSGWSSFHGVSKTKKEIVVYIQLVDGKELKCSSHHLIMLNDGQYYFAQDLSCGDVVVTEIGGSPINDIKIEENETIVYDINNVESKSEFYCNGILTHNCQFIEEAESIWTSAQPALSTGGKSVILSTPEGIGSFFHKMWVRAESGKNNFNTIKLNWRLHPERDEAWKNKQLIELGAKKFAQEFDCEFGASGNTVVANDIMDYYEKLTSDPVERRGEGLNLWIFKRVVEGRKYATIADVGRGDGDDFSAFHVIDLETFEQVAEFEHKIDTKAYGDVLINISTEYNDALLVIENNNIGWATIQRVLDRGYKNLFYMSSDMKYIDGEEQLTNRLYSEEKKMVPGFTTTRNTRPLIITKFEEYTRLKGIKINSIRLVNQMRTFIWHNGKAEAAKGYNDDLIMAMAIGMWIRDTALVLQNKRDVITKQLLGGIQRVGGDTNGTGGIYLPNRQINNPWETKIGGTTEDLRWLIR